MTINAPRRSTAAETMATAIRCPACKSGAVRHSRRRREDDLLRRLVFCAYRCRDCRARFWRFDGGSFVLVSAVVLTVGSAIAGGWALHKHQPPDPEREREPAEAESAAPATGLSTAMAPAAYTGLSELAARGEARAQASLAMAYLNGQGVAKDTALALKWAEKSALQGDPDGQYALASMHLAGRGTLQNFQTAFEWFAKAARQNHAASQYRLGTLYRSGHGVAVDKIRAYVWFSLAAAQGHHGAAEDRDSLLSALSSDQVARAQREAQDWRASSAKP